MPQRKLFDKKSLDALRKQPLYSTDGKGNDAVAHVRIFNPYGRGIMYLTEYDGNDTFYGYWKDSDMPGSQGEFGYFSKRDLENTRIRVGGVSLPLERDIAFRPTTIGKIKGVRDVENKISQSSSASNAATVNSVK